MQANAVAFLIAGIVLALFVSWRLRRKTGYWSSPPTKFTAQEDPFSFWLSLAIPSAIAVFLMIVGGSALLGAW